jgi:hypothetical protein
VTISAERPLGNIFSIGHSEKFSSKVSIFLKVFPPQQYFRNITTKPQVAAQVFLKVCSTRPA